MPSVFHIQHTKDKTIWLFIFMTGFVIGVLFINFWNNADAVSDTFFHTYTLEKMQYFEINHKQFFFFLVKERLQVIFLLALLSLTSVGIIICYLYIAWLGGALGILLGIMTMRFGLMGTILFGITVFPQYIIYVPAYYCLLKWCNRMCLQIHSPYSGYGVACVNKKQLFMRQILLFLLILGVVIIGIALECYVNPYFLKSFVKYL